MTFVGLLSLVYSLALRVALSDEISTPLRIVSEREPFDFCCHNLIIWLVVQPLMAAEDYEGISTISVIVP